MPRPRSFDAHAIDRFLERWYPDEHVDDPEARKRAAWMLTRLCENAVHVEDCPGDLGGEGQSIWDLRGIDEPVRVAVDRRGVVRTVFERAALQAQKLKEIS